MSKYWVYIDDKVAGPYTVDQLIRLRGFSRQARVCSQEGDEGPQRWTSPADIPELGHIFKAVEETRPVMLPPRVKAKPAPPKPRARASQETPAAPERPSKRTFPWLGLGITVIACALAAGGYLVWRQNVAHSFENERLRAQQLVENVSVAPPSVRTPFKQWLLERNIQPRWEFERQPTDLYHVSVIWFESGPHGVSSSVVNAFEVNLEAQTVRPLNSAAARLFVENKPPSAKPSPETAKPKPADFRDALSDWQNAVQSGDFDTVWGTFSERKIQDMSRGGISRSGFIRLQSLTRKLESGTKLDILKVKSEGNNSHLVLFKQVKKGQPDVFIRQLWVSEKGIWKLDDEQKKAAPSAEPPESPSTSSSDPVTRPSQLPVTSLPGISH